MKTFKVLIDERVMWSTEVEAKNRKEAVKKAEHIHMNGTLEGGGRDAHTFEHYSEENYQVNFK